jgi:hypothetical protein
MSLLKRAVQLVAGLTGWVFSMDAVISRMHGGIGGGKR